MIEEIPMPVAEVRAKTADEWAELWRVEADARNALWKEHREAKAAIKDAIPFLESHQDEGPSPHGWQSDELRNLVNKLKNFIQ